MTSSSSTPWTSSTSFWLLAALCAAQLGRGKAQGEQCPVEEGEEFNTQKVIIYVMTAICIVMSIAIFHLWQCVKRMAMFLNEETIRMVQPLSRADLVNRIMAAENNVLELQIQLNDNMRDIDILYRTLRRRAGPHPEEPSANRPRHRDRRPAEAEPEGELGSREQEPEIERAFNETASRSRDGGSDEERGEDSGRGPSEMMDNASIDEVTHDMDEHQRRHRRMWNRLHIMHVEANNMEVYLYTLVQQHGPDYVVPMLDIMNLYEEHAPSIEAPGDYRAQENFMHQQLPDGTWRFMLNEFSEEFGDNENHFVSQLGLYGFRNRRIILRENEDLTTREREDQVENLYSHFRLYDG